MPQANYKKAQQAALDLLEKYEIDKPVIPIFDIAKKEGVDIKIVDMEKLGIHNVSGFLDIKTKTIYVNSEDPSYRQMFTIAHELGHYELQHQSGFGVLPRLATLIDSNYLEKEANCFAANILVPNKILRNIMREYDLKSSDIRLLARIFGVSESVIKYRINQLDKN